MLIPVIICKRFYKKNLNIRENGRGNAVICNAVLYTTHDLNVVFIELIESISVVQLLVVVCRLNTSTNLFPNIKTLREVHPKVLLIYFR